MQNNHPNPSKSRPRITDGAKNLLWVKKRSDEPLNEVETNEARAKLPYQETLFWVRKEVLAKMAPH